MIISLYIYAVYIIISFFCPLIIWNECLRIGSPLYESTDLAHRRGPVREVCGLPLFLSFSNGLRTSFQAEAAHKLLTSCTQKL